MTRDDFLFFGLVDQLTPRLKKFVRQHIPAEVTYSADEVLDRLHAAGLTTKPGKIGDEREELFCNFEGPDIQYYTVTHPASRKRTQMYVWANDPIAGDWHVERITEESVVYRSAWFLRQLPSNLFHPRKKEPKVIRLIGETLGARVIVPLPERSYLMPLPFWYYHGTIPDFISHEVSGSTRAFLSEVPELVERMIGQLEAETSLVLAEYIYRQRN